MPASAVASFIDPAKIDALLAEILPDAGERAFVVRCITEEGPIHHRGASYALLRVVGALLEELGDAPVAESESVPIRLRRPPHLQSDDDDDDYPLRMPTRPLDALAKPGSTKHAALVDCLTDGPPHHALANAAMVALLDLAIERARAARGKPGS